MLDSLEAAREETEGALDRQREFVADASHELRTPLTSILANLELLADVLDGERGEAARSALRSSQRMRRLVGDLLLLARADANRQQPREPTDVSRVLVEVAAELGPVADGHRLTVDADDAVVDGARDELYRMTLNLVENAIRHTPEGTRIRATVARRERRRRARGAGRRAGRAARAARAHLRALRPRRGRPRLVQRPRASRSCARWPSRTAAASCSRTPGPARASSCACPRRDVAGARARAGRRLSPARARPLHDDGGHSRPPAAAASRSREALRARGRTRCSSPTHAPRADNVERLGLPVRPVRGRARRRRGRRSMSRLPGLRQSEGDALIIGEGFARIGAGGALPGFLWRRSSSGGP